ncbi:uncharacterized protein B0H64DRAFT_238745 [Chaetomium fimeti]|uniref:Uncharacterized protein n=1 Tax=Chaetomium fimeti TaxID=1854472 RepID=A0AAE0HAB3_9PEZI|nr:hypothetical protein B0H64DRAFT_238745 [Chaetomium fimeti]
MGRPERQGSTVGFLCRLLSSEFSPSLASPDLLSRFPTQNAPALLYRLHTKLTAQDHTRSPESGAGQGSRPTARSRPGRFTPVCRRVFLLFERVPGHSRCKESRGDIGSHRSKNWCPMDSMSYLRFTAHPFIWGLILPNIPSTVEPRVIGSIQLG